MERKPNVTLMSSSLQADSLTGPPPAWATHQFGAVHHLPRTQSWDPYEVWLNRVHRPRTEQGVRDALQAQAPPGGDACGETLGPLTIVRTIAR
jgi:hypothetical protein